MLSTFGLRASIFDHASSSIYCVSEYGFPVTTDTAAINR
jgi:hypothetical protein